MKRILAYGFIALGSLGSFTATVNAVSFNFNNPLVIPDGDPSGASDTHTITSTITAITSVTVDLNISADFNGDLYVYLRHGGDLAVLLNRTGRTTTDAFGYADSGFQVTLADGAPNGDIHTYQLVTTPPANTPLTGSWQPDGRAVDPDAVTTGSSRNALLNVFNGLNASGDWTLFLADLSGNSPSMLNSWTLNITGREAHGVPEAMPSTFAMQLGLLGLLAWGQRKVAQPSRS
jgi:subtilisin-like proprotein convertase family protein